MQLLFAVAQDLFWFAYTAVFGPRIIRTSALGTVLNDVIYVAPRPERVAITAPLAPPQPTHEESHAHLESVFEHLATLPKKNTIAYVATNGAPLRVTPERGVDNIIARMPFGAMLVAVEQVGEWVRVFHVGKEGYVELVDLADRAAFVHPKFVIGEENDANDPNTERVRAMIEDEFSYGEGESPLQAEEYVLYKLIRNGIRPVWPIERPRVPGTWARMVRGQKGVTVSTEPAPRAAMEWSYGTGAHIAFVEAVFPDGSIQFSEANWPERGIYNERVMVREEWQALTPSFIAFA